MPKLRMATKFPDTPCLNRNQVDPNSFLTHVQTKTTLGILAIFFLQTNFGKEAIAPQARRFINFETRSIDFEGEAVGDPSLFPLSLDT